MFVNYGNLGILMVTPMVLVAYQISPPVSQALDLGAKLINVDSGPQAMLIRTLSLSAVELLLHAMKSN